ncbi:helix-turn-helix domain-containing protein [Bathymodiolus thermophilus thioautotrophic gill symbiont]|uniref:HTH cro/C1-type domain-containing protein n=1 Tax=Bathymodiolus thermophilus thioautotrophic gill symbiont TaxID=2360 RepID=A0A1J5UAB3_9GAMM|nr:helix-turn-helix domain-containing protein [Bathymodiolus thermophilus thioautotrophic gill symbiont]OIR25289.1 hypothetical protein BGC33_06050 [Bathymodiolus thermophilus thioautotrophic gill symbiont]
MSKEIYKFQPDWLHLVPPGLSIKEDMVYIGLSQVDFAERMGYTQKHIHKLIKGEASITADTALKLEKVLSYPSSFWMNAESNYREALAKEEEKNELKKEGDWLKKIPLKNMIDFRWVGKFSNKSEQLIECLKFYGVASIKAFESQELDYKVAFKASDTLDKDNIAIKTWLRKGEVEAIKITCKPFSKVKLKATLDELRNLIILEKPDDFLPKLINLCAECGVAVVFAPTPKKCPMSGATQWISPDKALLLLSLRYKTNDALWFAFFHEIAHILKHKKQLFLEGRGGFVKDKQLESEADKFATELLIPVNFSAELSTLKTKASIKEFAKRINIAPGIVVGRMHHQSIIGWSRFNDLKVKYEWLND